MPKSKKSFVSDPNVELYDKLIATIPGLDRKGAANPYTSVNGNMFTLLHESTLAIRLPEDKREDFLMKHKTKLYEAYGAVMREYVEVPERLLKDTRELKKYLEVSYAYAKTLKPKATDKKSRRSEP